MSKVLIEVEKLVEMNVESYLEGQKTILLCIQSVMGKNTKEDLMKAFRNKLKEGLNDSKHEGN